MRSRVRPRAGFTPAPNRSSPRAGTQLRLRHDALRYVPRPHDGSPPDRHQNASPPSASPERAPASRPDADDRSRRDIATAPFPPLSLTPFQPRLHPAAPNGRREPSIESPGG